MSDPHLGLVSVNAGLISSESTALSEAGGGDTAAAEPVEVLGDCTEDGGVAVASFGASLDGLRGAAVVVVAAGAVVDSFVDLGDATEETEEDDDEAGKGVILSLDPLDPFVLGLAGVWCLLSLRVDDGEAGVVVL